MFQRWLTTSTHRRESSGGPAPRRNLQTSRPWLEQLEDRLAPASLPFSDTFDTAVDQQLSSDWTNQLGMIQVTAGGQAQGVGALDVATVNGILATDVAIQADVSLTASG